ncbi:MAG: ABC transporter ATP-binding protein [Planctomycetota bacterium]
MGLVLSARALAVRYRGRDTPSLEGVDLALSPGEVTLVTGPSGSGKTTLFRVINGLVPRSYPGSEVRGSARLEERDLLALGPAEIATRVGTLLQEPSRQVVGSTAEREIAFGPENLGEPVEAIAQRVVEVSARLGIEALLERAPGELSGGELQKVALAGVLAMHPRVLLLDEPLAALDPESAHEVALLLRELADEGRAVVVIEHRVEEIEAAAPERVLAVSEGRVETRTRAEFHEGADPRHLRLPVDVAIRRWRELGVEAESGEAARPAESAPPGAPVLAFEGVCFGYAERGAVLAGADLELREGETVALLGANGAGKSTLLRLAMGLLPPASGRVLLDGTDVADRTVAEVARRVGLLFQDPSTMLFADTVREECLFAPRNLGLADPDGRAQAALARLGLSELADESPGALSIGQRKRVCLAALAAQGVGVWLLDEPTAGLDPGGVAGFLAALRDGRKAEDAVLLATHDLDLALVLADRVAVVAEGGVAAVGKPAEVLLDDELLRRARLRRTSLLERNAERLRAGLAPLDARGFARVEERR